MNGYTKINIWSVRESLKAIENSASFILPDEIENLKKAIKIKHKLTELGFFVEHFQKEEHHPDKPIKDNFIFRVKKGNYTYGDVGHSFYVPVIKIWRWLQRSDEVEKFEFI